MAEATERDLILEHALENGNNLEIALDIGFAYPELRRQLIVDFFLKKLDRFVHQKLNEQWVVNSELFCAKPFGKFSEFFVEKKAWAGRYRVSLCAEGADARAFIIGVEKAERVPSIEGLKQALDTKIRPAKASPPWWEWYHQLEYPYKDWDNKEALIKMHDGTAVDFLGEYLVRIVNVAAPAIDRHVSTMPA